MKLFFKSIVTAAIIIALIGFLVALYTGVDPNSSLADKLRMIPLLKLVAADPEIKEDIQEKTENEGNAPPYYHGRSPRPYPTIALLDGTELYTEPDFDKPDTKKITRRGKYRITKRKDNWIQIAFEDRKVWVTLSLPVIAQKPAVEKSYINYDVLDQQRAEWYDKVIVPRIEKIKNTRIEWLKNDCKYYKLYFTENIFFDQTVFSEATRQLHNLYIDTFSTSIDLQKLSFKPTIFLIPYEWASREIGYKHDPARGGEYTSGIILINAWSYGPDGLLNTFLHEYTHHLNRQLLRLGGNGYLPLWLSEGLAEYFANHLYTSVEEYITRSDVIEGRIIYKEKTRIAVRSTRTITKKFRDQYRSKYNFASRLYDYQTPFPGEKLFSESPFSNINNSIFSNLVKKFYSTSWSTVSYLLEGVKGKHKPAFLRFIRDITLSKARTKDLLEYIEFDTYERLENQVGKFILARTKLEIFK